MPELQPVPSLQNLCFEKLARLVHHVACAHEASPAKLPLHVTEQLEKTISKLPAFVVQSMIPKAFEHVRSTVRRAQRGRGLLTLLRLLIHPQITKLDLNELFYLARLPAPLNTSISTLVLDKVLLMPRLTEFQLPSKCTDALLSALGRCCPLLQVVAVPLSDLVTDAGIVALSRGCPHLAVLDINKCFNITPSGISEVLGTSKKLRELNTEDLLHVLVDTYGHTHQTFALTSLTQTKSVYERGAAGLQWGGRACPQLQMLQLFVEDDYLPHLQHLPATLQSLDLEVTDTGDGLVRCLCAVGSTLTQLVLKYDVVSSTQLLCIGAQCPLLQHLHLTTDVITDAHLLENPDGAHYSALSTLHLHTYGEGELTDKCLELFLLHCPLLESVWVNAVLGFLTDAYLARLLQPGNSLTNLRKLYFSSDVPIQLTAASFYTVTSALPHLQELALTSWQVDERQFKDFRKLIQTQNLALILH